jgi:YggT family protein
MLLARLIDLYSLVVLVAVIVSWIQLPPRNPVVQLTRALTEPVLAPIRKTIPPVGGLDFSPLILLFGLQLIKGILF